MQPTPDRIRQDRRLIGQTLFRLSLPRLTILAVGIIIAVVIWRYASFWLLRQGPRIGADWIRILGQMDWLRILGSQATDIISRIINPYLWWALTAIWTILVLYALKAWVKAILAANRLYTVDSETLAKLRPRLSNSVIEVLRWVWQDHSEPFTIGDLQRAHRELRGNRIGKIALARAQSAILDQGADEAGGNAGRGEPAEPARAAAAPAAQQGPIEPTLGQAR